MKFNKPKNINDIHRGASFLLEDALKHKLVYLDIIKRISPAGALIYITSYNFQT